MLKLLYRLSLSLVTVSCKFIFKTKSDKLKRIKILKEMGQSQVSREKEHSLTQSDENHPIRKLNTKISYKIMPGFHFNKNILYCPEEEQFYRPYFTTKQYQAYICKVNGCKCRVQIRNNECFIANEMAHNHDKNTGMFYNLCALNEMKSILHSVDNQLSPREVFDDVIKR